MKKLIIIIVMLFVGNSYGQKVPYEKLESFSKEISQLQFEANGKSYNDGTNTIEISFPEENFTVAFNNQLATNVVYKKMNNKELMYLTENISLGRLVGFTSEVMDDIVVWKINFGKFTVTTQVFQDGKLIDTTTKNEMILYSYINTNRKATDPTFFKSFSELCNTMKKSIGLITDKELESENKDWEDKKNTMADFVKKHPNSVRTMQGKNIIANKEKLKLERGKKATSIIEYATEICNAYLWKPNMTSNEFKSYNPSISKESWTTTYLDGNSHYSRKMGVHFTVGGYLSEGPQSYTVNKSGEVSAFGTTIKKEKNSSKEIRKLYEDAKQISKEKVGSSNFSEKKGSPESFTISVPKSAEDPNSFQYYITTFIFEVDKWSFIQIHFHITNTP